MHPIRNLLAGLGAAALTTAASASTYTTVDMSAVKGSDFSLLTGGWEYSTITGTWTDPTGVPFLIDTPTNGDRLWISNDLFTINASHSPSPNLSITLNTSVAGAAGIYTLINTAYGIVGNSATVELFGSGSAYESVTLVGGVDIRDHNGAFWTNSTSSPNTTTVFDSGSGRRIDRQWIALDSSFAGQTLTKIVITDLVPNDNSDLIVAGVTVSAVPEPATFGLMLAGLLGVLAVAARRRTH
jgi:hypothetical protein